MDNFGFDDVASGAVPVRNATRAISWSRGELRHWQLDDDYTGFARYSRETGQNKAFKAGEGQEFYDWLLKIAYFGYVTNMANVGYALATIESNPACRYRTAGRIFNAHNMPSNPELFQEWRGRMNDDLINALDVARKGKREFSFNFLQINMPPSQQEEGGLTQLYKDVGTVRKTAYAVMAMPSCVKLVIKYGRYHHKVDWQRCQVKILNEKWKKVEPRGAPFEGNQQESI